MLLRRVATLLVLVLTAVVVLGSTVPAWAHGAPSAAQSHDASASRDEIALATGARDDALRTSLTAASRASPDFPWPVLLAGLVGVAFGVHRRRRVLALALVLFLVSFAFEIGLHSVHHGADPRQIAACAAAAASAHLTGIPVACDVAIEVILPAVAATPELDPSRSPMSPLRPDQGRAPPA